MTATLQEVLDHLGAWVEAGWLRELDRAFAAFLAREHPGASPALVLVAALASHQLGRGHACLDLEALLQDARETLALPPDEGEGGSPAVAAVPPSVLLAGMDLPRLQTLLDDEVLVGAGEGGTPLVRVGTRLYLRRYWQHEQSVGEAIRARLQRPFDKRQAARLRDALAVLFPSGAPGGAGPDWQKVACALAVRSGFAIVTGGPGTGKTTTVVKLLAVLQHLALDGTSPQRLRIRLAAPTGKAAARLNESIANAVRTLPLGGLPQAEALRAAIPTDVVTVHRLLGPVPGSRRFRHDALNPLPLDVLVLDEASMVGLEAMAAVVAALPARARLVLLGDKDQLASVEAGGLLGELCRRADGGHYLPATADWLHAATGEAVPPACIDRRGEPLDQAVVKLRHSHRFDARSGIGRLARAVNAGDAAALRAIRDEAPADLAWVDLASGGTVFRDLVLDGRVRTPGAPDGEAGQPVPVGLRHYLQVLRAGRPAATDAPAVFDAWAQAVLAAYGEFQLLCAVRRGPWGVERVNQRIGLLLQQQGLLASAQGWAVGRPVMVTHNDYALGLMNGDVGVTLELPVHATSGGVQWLPRVAFPDGSGGVRWVLPSRLQSVETVYAMTVHKSQGSEFTHVALVLPERPSPVLTRELVYTGITRARRWFTVAGPLQAGLLEFALERPTRRSGGALVRVA